MQFMDFLENNFLEDDNKFLARDSRLKRIPAWTALRDCVLRSDLAVNRAGRTLNSSGNLKPSGVKEIVTSTLLSYGTCWVAVT